MMHYKLFSEIVVVVEIRLLALFFAVVHLVHLVHLVLFALLAFLPPAASTRHCAFAAPATLRASPPSSLVVAFLNSFVVKN